MYEPIMAHGLWKIGLADQQRFFQLYVDTVVKKLDQDEGYDDNDEEESETETATQGGSGHPFAGYYLPYPDTSYEGLVSTICDDPPVLNWIYVDSDTYQVKYGLRVEAQPNITGPFDCTRQDRRMTLEGWEGFVVVEEPEQPGTWSLYFDRDDNGLRGKVAGGRRVLEVELWRREKRWKKDPDVRQQEQAKQTTT